MAREVYLICCESDDNHNKYYKMTTSPDGTSFEVEYGRVGASCQRASYPISQWDKKYKEKLKKGYKDVTELRSVPTVTNKGTSPEFPDVTDASIRALIDELRRYADIMIKNNYTVGADVVTDKMVNAVKERIVILENLFDKIGVGDIVEIPMSATKKSEFYRVEISLTAFKKVVQDFNNILQEIFTIIPRKMKSVSEALININKVGYFHKNKESYISVEGINFISKLIQNERDLISTMGVMSQQVVADSDNAITLKSLGIEITPCSAKDIETIKKELGDCASKFDKAWCVKHIASNKAFEDFKKNNKGDYKRFPTKLLWHGSRNENWWSIINNSLKLNPNGAKITGKMFGAGIYFAPKARKSLGYTSLDGYWTRENSNVGYMALYATAYGKPYNTDNNYKFSSTFGWKDLKKLDSEAHCVHAHSGSQLRNDEIIFYNESQVTIKYLVRLKKN